MKTIVIYNSQTGFTKRYAQWIAQESGSDFAELSAAKKKDLTPYDAIVFAGSAFAGNIRKIRWFKVNIDKWADKKLIAVCVGASPADNPEIQAELERIFTQAELKRVKTFYCPGGLNYEQMPTLSKLMMKMLVVKLWAKKDKTEKEQAMMKMISSSYDVSDKKYIDPILQYLKNNPAK